MERRWRQRKAAELDVLVNHQSLGRLPCLVRDLSYDGARIDTGASEIPVSCHLDLEFPPLVRVSDDRVNIAAYVVHRRGQEVGVMFRDYPPSVLSFLQTLMASS